MGITTQVIKKYHYKNSSTSDLDIVVVYGDINGPIMNCKDVIVINGDIKGNVVKCENVCGLLAERK